MEPRAAATPRETTDPRELRRRLAAEFLGTALLLAIVAGSGIMGESLSGGNVAIALLANTIATGAGLVTLILAFGPISGAQFNPVVTVVMAAARKQPWGTAPWYVGAQIAGAFVGVVAAHGMFGLPALSPSQHERANAGLLLGEFIATFGLIGVIRTCVHHREQAVPYAVGAYITAAYWFTSSTSFANPAVTMARAFTDTFAGIRPADAPAFIAAQILGAAAAALTFGWLLGTRTQSSTLNQNT